MTEAKAKGRHGIQLTEKEIAELRRLLKVKPEDIGNKSGSRWTAPRPLPDKEWEQGCRAVERWIKERS